VSLFSVPTVKIYGRTTAEHQENGEKNALFTNTEWSNLGQTLNGPQPCPFGFCFCSAKDNLSGEKLSEIVGCAMVRLKLNCSSPTELYSELKLMMKTTVNLMMRSLKS
jgi:hypothetical protein